jgi:hypothetical protein
MDHQLMSYWGRYFGLVMQVLRLMRQLEDLRLGELIKEFCDLFVVNPYDRSDSFAHHTRLGPGGRVRIILSTCWPAQDP